MQPTEQELRATVRRMETQLGHIDRSDMALLFKHYQMLCSRFKADLADGRDLALAQASVLMLIQSVVTAA